MAKMESEADILRGIRSELMLVNGNLYNIGKVLAAVSEVAMVPEPKKKRWWQR